MSVISRRSLLAASFLSPAVAQRNKFRIATMDNVLGLSGDPKVFAVAKELGLDGVQLTLSAVKDPAALRAESKRLKIPIVATYLDILHKHCLKRDPEASADVRAAIETTRQLGAPICMLVFFGGCALNTDAEMDAVIPALKELSPLAAQAGVVLGFENLLNAPQNQRVLAAVQHKALKIYYDIGNSTNSVQVDPAAEIRALGGKQICQVHVKDKGYLGEGKVNVAAAVRALEATGYRGYLVLETSSPSGDRRADTKRNFEFLRRA